MEKMRLSSNEMDKIEKGYGKIRSFGLGHERFDISVRH